MEAEHGYFMPIQPKPTRYKGYHFRSRLEARWAVFFDHLDVRWEYEPERFELPGGRSYLPDFLIRLGDDFGDRWIEVKPEPRNCEPLAQLVSESKISGAVLAQPWAEEKVWQVDSEVPGFVGLTRLRSWFGDFARMLLCERLGLNPELEAVWDEIDAACDAARSARFEWGESGAT